MAVRFWELYEETKDKFRLKIIAGEAGMNTVVSWVHMIEDENIVSRFHGEELAITTGIKADEENWLLNLIQEMAKGESAGIIINTGMYLKEIPLEVIRWCDENHFPLLEMPWEIAITNLIQDFCTRIIDQKQYEKIVSKAFKEMIQGTGNIEEFKRILEQRYDVGGSFQMFYINVKKLLEEEVNFNHAIFKLENLFGNWKGSKKIEASYGLIRMEDSVVLVLNNMPDKFSRELPEMILQCFSYFVKKKQFYFGVGPKGYGMEHLSIGYKRAKTAMKMAMVTGKAVVKFEEMGFFKILFSIEDSEILSSYASEILGELEQYDKNHKSSYLETLRSYIKNDRSLLRVAEDTFTHRNTVNYRINNIKRLLGCELKDSEELFPYQVAFYIREMEKRS